MANIYYDQDADLSLLNCKQVAIIGYGSQWHAHSLNLKDSGVSVVVGLHQTSKSRAKAAAEGLRVQSVTDAAKESDIVMMLVPDPYAPKIYKDSIELHMSAGKTLMFAHGFNIRFGQIVPPKDVDVSMIAPKAPGHRMREVFQQGLGVRRWSPCTRTRAARRRQWRWRTPKASARRARRSSRRPSPRKPRPTCSASRRCCAAA